MNPLNFRALPAGAALAGLVLLAGCHPPAPAPTAATNLPPAKVSVAVVQRTGHVAVEEVVGTVRARTRTVVEAKVAGRIVRMETRLGQPVRAGERLVELDATELTARLDQTRGVFEQASRDRDRFRGLLEQKTVSPQEYDAVEARWRVAKAAMAEAESLAGYLRVVAPFDAVVSRKLADVGDQATPGRPLLELEVPGELRLEADVGEALIGRLEPGQQVSVRVGTMVMQGKVAEMAPAADPVSRTFLVKVDLPSGAGLRSGQFGRLSVPLGESPVLRVPAVAVLRRGQLEYVMVDAGGRAQLRLVRTGRMLGADVELVSGVEPGERVVSGGLEGLAEGQPLEVGR